MSLVAPDVLTRIARPSIAAMVGLHHRGDRSPIDWIIRFIVDGFRKSTASGALGPARPTYGSLFGDAIVDDIYDWLK